VTRRPDLARACHQLERHGSGTPNDVVPEPQPWTLAGFAEALQAAFTGPFNWPSLRVEPGQTASMDSSASLSTETRPTLTMAWDHE
jgi:hypothetical protein